MVTTIDSTGLPTNVLIERRRPGRAKYANPHLIALLRNSTEAASDDQVDVAKDRNDLRLDRGREARLSKTISLIDGASQVGIPHPVTNLEHESRTLWYGPFLANQCCYVAGTEIATSHGAMPIEKVAVGDVVLSLSGNRRVTWTGRFSINPSAEPNPERTAPVCIRRDAFASGLPGQDQWVSPLHCLWVDNRLVPARLLINNMTVIQDLLATSVTYCHLLFDKSAHGQLAASVDLVKPIWDRLSERAEHLGCGRASPTEAVDLSLQILADGKPIHPTEIVGSRQVFVVPPGHEIFHVWSNSFAAVVMVEIIAKDVYQVIPADHPDLLLGWGPCQREGGRDWRCVEGAALLPISQVSGGMQIVVHLRKSGRAYAEIQKSLDEINQKVPATSSQ